MHYIDGSIITESTFSPQVKLLETEKRSLERQLSSSRCSAIRSKSYDRDKEGLRGSGAELNLELLEQENRELRARVRKLEAQLAQSSSSTLETTRELERLRAAQHQAEKLLESRELGHRHQVLRLESQLQLLKEQLHQEAKRRQMYVLRSSRAAREMQQLRQALGDSLRTVAQDPAIDALLLEHEARKLDTTLASSLPPCSSLQHPIIPLAFHSPK